MNEDTIPDNRAEKALKYAEFTIARDKRQNAALGEILSEIERLMKMDDRATQGPNTRLTNAFNVLVNIQNLATNAMGGMEP